MKKTVFALAVLHSAAYANPGLDGEYLCNDCHGYLTVKPAKANAYKVWLGVGGGSCGGEVFVKNDAARPVRNTIILTWKLRNKVCRTTIAVQGKHAFVSDSCVQPEHEDASTCAVIGDYTWRDATNNAINDS